MSESETMSESEGEVPPPVQPSLPTETVIADLVGDLIGKLLAETLPIEAQAQEVLDSIPDPPGSPIGMELDVDCTDLDAVWEAMVTEASPEAPPPPPPPPPEPVLVQEAARAPAPLQVSDPLAPLIEEEVAEFEALMPEPAPPNLEAAATPSATPLLLTFVAKDPPPTTVPDPEPEAPEPPSVEQLVAEFEALVPEPEPPVVPEPPEPPRPLARLRRGGGPPIAVLLERLDVESEGIVSS